jgi:hypothetical protein
MAGQENQKANTTSSENGIRTYFENQGCKVLRPVIIGPFKSQKRMNHRVF